MRPKKHEATKSGDLFRARLDQIINLKHELAQLAGAIDWDWIDGEIAPLYSEKGRPGTDEGVCERWVYDPYFQHFTGEEFFTTNARAPGGLFVLHAKALPGN